MSRDRRKKFGRHVRSSGWFRPSREDAALYRALVEATRAMSVKELCDASRAAPSTVDHTCRFWTEKGLLRRVFLDKKAWFRWQPQPRAKEMAEALAAAAELAEELPRAVERNSKASPNALSAALKKLAEALVEVAEDLEKS